MNPKPKKEPPRKAALVSFFALAATCFALGLRLGIHTAVSSYSAAAIDLSITAAGCLLWYRVGVMRSLFTHEATLIDAHHALECARLELRSARELLGDVTQLLLSTNERH